jgi:hypothetical protein
MKKKPEAKNFVTLTLQRVSSHTKKNRSRHKYLEEQEVNRHNCYGKYVGFAYYQEATIQKRNNTYADCRTMSSCPASGKAGELLARLP